MFCLFFLLLICSQVNTSSWLVLMSGGLYSSSIVYQHCQVFADCLCEESVRILCDFSTVSVCLTPVYFLLCVFSFSCVDMHILTQ